ncbi:MAG TPA: AAA family ATPase [Actinocrinis sp.]|nr:AAA family ATPase [Actinocrinis sp.]
MNHAPPRPPLRGRSEQMGRVLDVLRRAGRSGQGAVVLVTGEAGIGKTALLGVAAEQAARLGFAVGAGRADESSARVAPLAALFAALRSGRPPLLAAEAFGEPGPVHDRELWLVDRIAPLPALSLDLARAGAVLGQSFAADDVVGLVGGFRDRAVALPGLEPLVRAGILADDGSTISFRHDLLRQAVYADIPPTVRKAMHRAAARHLMSVGGKTRVVDAAAHVLASAAPGDLEAVDVLREAARGAAGMAPVMAADLIREAFALLAPGDGLWAEVGLETVAMLAQARRAHEAMTVADRLLAVTSDASADVVARAEGLLTLPLWSMGLLRELRERAEKGLAAADLPGPGRARLLAQLALASSRDDDLDAARTVGADALAAARQLGDASAEGAALWALGEIERNDGRNEIALGHFERLRDLAGTAYSADEILTLQLLDR